MDARICPACLGKVPENKQRSAIYCSERCRATAMRRRCAEEHRAVRGEQRTNDPLRHLLYRIRHKCKTRSIPFDLVAGDLAVPERCPILGIPLVWNLGRGQRGYLPNSPSIDRIYPDRGYIKGNVRIISARANLLKNNASLEEIEAIYNDLKSRDQGNN